MFHKQIEFYYETWYMTFTIMVDVYGHMPFPYFLNL